MTTSLAQRLASIQQRIDLACEASGRSPSSVTLIAVSKTFEVDVIRQAYELGVRDFGESYVQEWTRKREELPGDIRWHFIGHLQSNKVKYLTSHIHLLHSIDRASILKALDKYDGARQAILLQFNVAGEAQKSGAAPDELEVLLERLVKIPHLTLEGCMTVPPYDEDAERSRTHFAALRDVRDRARRWLAERDVLDAHPCQHLSMGMSGDFEVAIEEGATLVRVGSALFGERDYI